MSGYSRLTSVPIFGYYPQGYAADPQFWVAPLFVSPPYADERAAKTPTCFSDPFTEDDAPPSSIAIRGCSINTGLPLPAGSAGLNEFTSQVAMRGTVRGNRYAGTLYTKDTGIITADFFVGQVVLIVGGTDDFEDATGRIAVAGQELGGSPGAFYTGHICVNR